MPRLLHHISARYPIEFTERPGDQALSDFVIKLWPIRTRLHTYGLAHQTKQANACSLGNDRDHHLHNNRPMQSAIYPARA